MFDPKISYSFSCSEEVMLRFSGDLKGDKEEIEKLKKETWELLKTIIPQEYFLSIKEKIEITDDFVNYICEYKPLTER